MTEENTKGKAYKYISIIGVFGIVFSLIAISISGAHTFISGDFWSLNSDTVVLSYTSNKVCIGKNETSDWSLTVHGPSLFNDTINIGNYYNYTTIGYDTVNHIMSITGDIKTKKYAGFDSTIFTDNISLSNKLTTTDIEAFDTIDTNTINAQYVNCYNSVISVNFSGYGIIPMGGTVSWCNHIGNITLLLPNGFWVCNGSTINDVDSIFNGQPSPNLTNRFIRGSDNSTSGKIGGNNSYTLTKTQMPSHEHTYINHALLASISQGLSGIVTGVHRNTALANTGSTGGGLPFDNQPSYYDMVILVRIK